MSLDEAPGPGGVPMPEAFHSFETGAPFERCSVCSRALADGVPHLIEKGFVKGETIYEFAICETCHDSIRGELSEESKERIESYLRERMRRRVVIGDPLSRCLFSDRPLGDEFLICGLFLGRSLMPGAPPFAVSGEEVGKLAELLSKPTRERLDSFTDEVLGIPGLGNPVPLVL